MHKDLLVGEIAGWRLFDVPLIPPYLLRSTVVPYVWVPGSNTAMCFRGPLTFGTAQWEQESSWKPLCESYASHRCGLYAMKDVYRALPDPSPHSNAIPVRYGSPTVLAQVSLWGRILEGRVGYRAQFAKVVAIGPNPRTVAPVPDAAFQALALQYDAPILTIEEIQNAYWEAAERNRSLADNGTDLSTGADHGSQ